MVLQDVRRDLQVAGDRVEHLLRGLPQAALDLREVRIGDPRELRQLAQRDLLHLALAADEGAERGFAFLIVGHPPRIV